MSETPSGSARRFRLGALIWLAAMIGLVATIVQLMPRLTAELALPAPLWLIGLAGILQNGLLLALATWAGVALTPKLGFGAPLFEAAAERRPVLPLLEQRLRLGLLAGVPAGLALVVFTRLAPPEIAGLAERFEPPILARLLYGGITEEVLMRWGAMTVLTWLMWRFVQRSAGAVRPAFVITAIVASSLLFGLGHLPAAHFLLGGFTPAIVGWVIGANTSFGLLFGWLYWRRGLESAMAAHAMTHMVSYLVDRA